MTLDFVIVGAQKGGSTALAGAITQHPQVWMPAGEEPIFRDPVYTPEGAQRLLASCADHGDATIRGIKCPDYLSRPEVLDRLRDDARSPKIIACLRDPVARALSAYFWHVRWGLLPVEEASTGMESVLNGTYDEIDPTAREILTWGLYGASLQPYFDMFGANKIHVMLSDDTRLSSAGAYRSLYSFLGVAPDFIPNPNARAANEGIYNPIRLHFGRLRNRYVLQWDSTRTYASIPPAHRGWPAIFSRSVAAVDQLLLRPITSNRRPVLSATVESRLREYYYKDVVRLEMLIGRDLKAWR